jgi:hypothetical protein
MVKPSSSDQRNSLNDMFRNSGSDKSTHHDYHEIYADIIFCSNKKISKVLEVGIGSNDLTVPQNMGEDGVPGAALRAFSRIIPDADIFGADVDPNSLITEGNIKSHFVNQLDLSTFEELQRFVGKDIDLLIIDGLHTPRADLNTLLALYENVADNGFIVIEDIAPKAAHYLWPVLVKILNRKINIDLHSRKNGHLLVIQK